MQTSALPLGSGAVFGADDEIRTRDLILTKDVRYHLSHISIERGERRFLPKRGIAAPLRGRAGAGPPDWSGLRGSNPLPRPWQGRALPNELNPHKANYFALFIPRIKWCLRSESNQRHGDFQSPALPTELQRQKNNKRQKSCRFYAVKPAHLATRMGLEPTTSSVTG